MKKLILLVLLLLFVGGISVGTYFFGDKMASLQNEFEGDDPDMPLQFQTGMTKEEFMMKRSEYIAELRGVEEGKPFDPTKRIKAVKKLEKQEIARAQMPDSVEKETLTAAWTEIGPNPIPLGQVVAGPQLPVSGRTIGIAVHPTNPDIVYVGTAQGGLYRTTDGGTTWTPMLDNALSLAVNTVAISPSQPDTIFAGTGESGFSADSFFGVGIYRIDNASTANPIVTGPIGGASFTGRAIGKIVVHPTDPNIIFASSTSGLGGIGSSGNNVLAARGLFRSTNALAANPTFTKMTITGPAAQDRNILDIVMDPGNPNLVLCTEVDSFALGEGGVYRSTDALAANPTFVRTLATTGTGTGNSRTELALNRSTGGVVTVYAASASDGGTVHQSTNGGASFALRIDNNFCGGQCFYDIAVDVDPVDANRVYIGGTGTTATFAFSANGGTTFTNSQNGLHTDSHAIAVAPSLPSTIYFGSDGGIYKSTDSGGNWTSLNNTTFRATQFLGLAVHPTDPNFTIGGTQDNGTNFYNPSGIWRRTDFGDGGYAVIDQNATDTTNVRMYHTYFNNATLQGYGTTTLSSVSEGGWAFRGCNGAAGNGIPCNGAVLFYAPLEQGPGNPNTIYYGANILYRSADNGTNHTAVSQSFGTDPISAIGVSPTNDNVRIIGTRLGKLFGTTTGSAALTDFDAGNAVPNNFVARAIIDPNNINTAYVSLSGFGIVNVWRATNLSSGTPIWTALTGTGANVLPQVPVNAFLVDPVNSNILYAGTDIGVYVSSDAGANWVPFGTGLPRVAVFDLAKTAGNFIRIATHGRGMWEILAFGAVPVPIISAAGATLVSESCQPANGVIDPGETVTVAFAARNNGTAATVNDVGTLQATGGIIRPGAAQNYGVIAAGGGVVSRTFTFTADPTLACGANLTATIQHQDGATDLGSITYALPTGSPGTTTTASYTGPPVAVPDNVGTGVNIVLPVSGVTGLINDLNFRLDAITGCDTTTGNPNASVTHTFNGDLSFKLTSPQGTTVSLIASRGGAGQNFCTVTLDDDGGFPAASTIPATGAVTGNFAPESPLSAFDGQNANGNWTLNVADTGAADTGTLNRFSLLITPTVCLGGCIQGVEGDVQSRPNGDGFVDDSDIQQIRRFSIGLDKPYQSNEFQRADASPRGTSGDGDVDDGDIQQVRRYAIGLDAKQNAAGPTVPNPIAPPVSSKVSGGAVKGKASVITKDGVQAAPAAFRVDAQNTSAGSTLVVPIRVDTVGNEAGYTFSIAFDSTKLTNPSVVIGNSGGDVLFNANNPGQIGFSVTTFSGGTIAEGNNKILVTVTFTVAAGAQSGTTPITFTDTPARRKASPVDPNFPITQPTYTGGTITIGGATAAGASLSGRVMNVKGRGVANAKVIITDGAGEVVATARTNGFGYYRIADIESGAAYIVRVESKQYQFDVRTINVAQDLDGIDFTAQPR